MLNNLAIAIAISAALAILLITSGLLFASSVSCPESIYIAKAIKLAGC